jgi:large subunit ribosomal protein L25
MNNGLVDQQMMEIQVRTTPRDIPDELVIDINEMTVDTVITVADVDLPSGVTAVSAEDQTVVTVVTLRVAAEEPAAEEGEGEGAEGDAEASEESSDGGSDNSGDSDAD